MEENEQCSSQLFDNAEQSKMLTNFFEQRGAFIKENKYPTTLTADPAVRFVMYLIPQKFQEIDLDIKKLESANNFLIPLGEAENTIICDFNFDGILFHSSIHVKHSYTQVFRDGKVEMVVAVTRFASNTRENLLPLIKLQKSLLKCLTRDVSLLSAQNVPGPYHLYFHLLAAEGIRIDPRDIASAGYETKGVNKALIRNELHFPIYKLEHAHVNIEQCLQPFFDILWNTFGFKEAPQLKSEHEGH